MHPSDPWCPKSHESAGCLAVVTKPYVPFNSKQSSQIMVIPTPNKLLNSECILSVITVYTHKPYKFHRINSTLESCLLHFVRFHTHRLTLEFWTPWTQSSYFLVSNRATANSVVSHFQHHRVGLATCCILSELQQPKNRGQHGGDQVPLQGGGTTDWSELDGSLEGGQGRALPLTSLVEVRSNSADLMSKKFNSAINYNNK